MAETSKPSDLKATNRNSMRFSGKLTKCVRCDKAVYKMEEVLVDNQPMHKSCFKCNHCSRQLTLSNFAAVNNKLFCKPHYMELFQSSGGSYAVFGDAGFKNTKGQNTSPTNTMRKSPSASTTTQDVNKADTTKAALTTSSSSSSIRDKVKAYEKSSRPSLSPSSSGNSDTEGKPNRQSLSVRDRLQQYQQAVGEEAVEVDTERRSKSPQRRPLSGRIQERMRRFEESNKSEESENQEKEEARYNFQGNVPELAAGAIAQRTADALDDDEEDGASTFTDFTAVEQAQRSLSIGEKQDNKDDLQNQLNDALEKLRVAESEAQKWQSEFKIAESNNQKLRQELAEVRRDLQTQVVKTMEADEWCAKISKDMESLKLRLGESKSATLGSLGGAVIESPRHKLIHRESESSIPMDGITEDCDEEDDGNGDVEFNDEDGTVVFND